MAKSSGVWNILALRGDPPQGKRAWKINDVSGGECHRAIDLVKLIRKLHGDYFGIGVAGHPEGHPSSPKTLDGQVLEMQHLKEKIDAGGQFIITQFFYDTNVFIDYVKRCRDAGIHCPIIPGIMPIQSYSSLVKMTQFCGISVPSSVINRLQDVRLDDEAVKLIGVEIASEMCRTILASSDSNVDGFHFYTLNLERSTTRILINLGTVDMNILSQAAHVEVKQHIDNTIKEEGDEGEDGKTNHEGECIEVTANGGATTTTSRRERSESISDRARSNGRRVLPWKPSAMENRSKEDVRPINWSNR